MIKYRFPVVLVLFVFALPNIFTMAQTSQENDSPNIILFLTDDQGWTDTSVQMMEGRTDAKSDYYQTPNLDRLADEGMIFSNAYSPAPVCTPTRFSIQTGKTPARLKSTGHYSIANKQFGESLSVAQAIKAANSNYKTAHFGKWGGMNLGPEQVGYDASDGPTNNYHGDWRSTSDERALPPDDPKRIFSTTRKANTFMEEQVAAGRPFYLQLSHYALHVQHRALKETINKYKKLAGEETKPADYKAPPPPLNEWAIEYAAMIENLDTGLGMILDKIEGLGIEGNTYIIFTSDNGGGFRGNDPLKAGKSSAYEGGIRVPTVIRGPGVKGGSYSDVPIAGWDFLPTFVDLAGGNVQELPDGLDGGSLRPVLENEGEGVVPRETEELIFHSPFPQGNSSISAIRDGDYKLVKNWMTREIYLFNLVEDLEESRDLKELMPHKAQELHEKLGNYLEGVNAQTAEEILKGQVEHFKQAEKDNQARKRETVWSQSPDARDNWADYHRRSIFLSERKKYFRALLHELLESKYENL